MNLQELEHWLEYSHSPYYPGDPKSLDLFRPTFLTHENKIVLFRDYLDTMESYLEQERQKKRDEAQEYESWIQSGTTEAFNKLNEDIKAGRISSDPETVSMHEQNIMQSWRIPGDMEGYWLHIIDEFADILRQSFFVNLYGFWESQLFPLCASLKHYDDCSKLDLGVGKEFTMKQAKSFLRKIGFPLDTKTWSDINHYRILRNCFVHHNGNPNGMEKADQRKLESLIRSKNSLLAWGYEVTLDKGFCEKALETIEKYFYELLDALANWNSVQKAS